MITAAHLTNVAPYQRAFLFRCYRKAGPLRRKVRSARLGDTRSAKRLHAILDGHSDRFVTADRRGGALGFTISASRRTLAALTKPMRGSPTPNARTVHWRQAWLARLYSDWQRHSHNTARRRQPTGQQLLQRAEPTAASRSIGPSRPLLGDKSPSSGLSALQVAEERPL